MPLQKTGYIDLHIHSTASDGSLSPKQIIQTAQKTRLRAISITDHDTLEGTIEALGLSEASPLEIIPGIEISARFPPGTMHILGYFININDLSFNHTLERLQNARSERNLKIINKLQRLGIGIAYSDVVDIAGKGQIGRPHFAQALVRKRIVPTVEEAFEKLLKKGRPAYASRYRLEPAEAIQAVVKAGGIAVLAHPSSLKTKGETALGAVLSNLKEAGLQGMEIYYPGLNPRRKALFERLATFHHLVRTGGTDFHGKAKPQVHMGFGEGDLRIPYHIVKELKARRFANLTL